MFKVRNKIRAGYKDIIHKYKTAWKTLEKLLHQPHGKLHPLFLRPNGILNHSNRPKGMITTVLGMSLVDIGT